MGIARFVGGDLQERDLLPGPDLPAEAGTPPTHHSLPHPDGLQVRLKG
ncbi:MAG: hypothetical protein ACK55Z_06890 [bacterium]